MTDDEQRKASYDRTESKVREWALKRNGDPVAPHDVIELVLAVDEDSCSRSDRIESKLDKHILSNNEALDKIAAHLDDETAELKLSVDKTLQEHIAWTAEEPMPRIERLEQRVDFLFSPRRSTDPMSTDFSDKRSDFVCASTEELLYNVPAERARAKGSESPSFTSIFSRELQDMTTTWRVLRWLLMIAVAGILVWGLTFWANSCAAQNVHQSSSSAQAAFSSVSLP